MQITPIYSSEIKHQMVNTSKTSSVMPAAHDLQQEIFEQKNPGAILSIGAEHKGLGLSKWNLGGEAVVLQDAAADWSKRGVDIRSILPLHAGTDDGKIYVINKKNIEDPKKLILKESDLKKVDADYKLLKDEIFVALEDSCEDKKKYLTAPDANVKRYKFLEITPTDIKGTVDAATERGLNSEKIKYRVFKLATDKHTEPIYFMHTKPLAFMIKAYNSDKAYAVGQVAGAWSDFHYSNFCRSVVDAIPQFAQKEGFNPANLWCHDRQAYTVGMEIARRSANGEMFFNGIHIQNTMHNSGPIYQGICKNLLSFFKLTYNKEDFEKLKTLPDYQELLLLSQKNEDAFTENEKKRLDIIFKKHFPALFDHEDKLGNLTEQSVPNMTKIAIASRRINPENCTLGTVSRNFGLEMKSNPCISEGLTHEFSSIDTIDIVNGSTPGGLKLSKITEIGKDGNGLSKLRAGYFPYSPNIDEGGHVTNYFEPTVKVSEAEIEKLQKDIFFAVRENKTEDIERLSKLLSDRLSVKDAKRRNKIWLLDLISSCVDKNGNPDSTALKNLFYNSEQINVKNMKVHGFLSKFSEKDKIFVSWGRADEQKGFSTLVKGFYKFLSNPKIPDEEKSHAKLLFGSGGTWAENAPDYKIIKEHIRKIQELGYKNNICYVEGFFPSKLVAAADYGIFTSRFEPCGITPLETFSSGSPTLSIRTGGAPDFIRSVKDKTAVNPNGILTNSPYLIPPEEFGFTEADKAAADFASRLDKKQMEKASGEVADLFKQAMEIDDKTYHTMAKNACEEKIQWDKNALFNGGKSANQRYFEDVFGIRLNEEKGCYEYIRPRSLAPMSKLTTSEFGDASRIPVDITPNSIAVAKKEAKRQLSDNLANTTQSGSKFLKRLLHDKRTYYAAAAITAVAGIAAYALNRDKAQQSNVKFTTVGNSKIYF